jgi:hypothetical protein
LRVLSGDLPFGGLRAWSEPRQGAVGRTSGPLLASDQVRCLRRRRARSDPPRGGGDGRCACPSVSADGDHVAFGSWAVDLAAGDVPETFDIYVRKRPAATTCRVVLTADGDPLGAEMAVYIARSRGWDSSPGEMNAEPKLFPDVPAGH